MKFLLDANMPRSTAGILRELGHEVEDVRDVLPGGVEDILVAVYAKTAKSVLITRDFDFADIRNYPPQDFVGIIVLELPDDAVATQINSVFKTFINQPEMLNRLNGRLRLSRHGVSGFDQLKPNHSLDLQM